MALCQVCEIYAICHEPMKGHAEESCIYFTGKIPEGYVRLVSPRKLHERKWRGYAFYIVESDGKRKWLTEQDIRYLKRKDRPLS